VDGCTLRPALQLVGDLVARWISSVQWRYVYRFRGLLDALGICKKAAVSGEPVVDIAIEKVKKAIRDKAKEDLKRKLSPATN
jgi:hypothetical protein